MSIIPTPTIIRSVRRTLALHISSTGELIVKAPFFLPEKLINNFIREKEEWILQRLGQVEKRKTKQRDYQEGEEFLYLGTIYKLHIGDFKEIGIENGFLNFPAFMKFRIKKELTDWYIKQAKKQITTQLDYYTVHMNTTYKSVRFSDTSSKWGSCFPDNSLQFNWRLVMAPLMVLTYVVIHELAHTTEKNHGLRFWNKVQLYTPAYKQHRKWLERNNHLLRV